MVAKNICSLIEDMAYMIAKKGCSADAEQPLIVKVQELVDISE